jgi:uncharacterized protein YggE
MDANAKAMAKVIQALKDAGIAKKDLQTEFVSVNPRYDGEGQKITGYSASNSVSALVRGLSDVGDVIDAAVAAGANNVSGPSLARDDQDKLYRDALEKAVADAREKAAALARAAGVSLGEVRSLAESPESPGPIVYGAAMRAMDAGTPIEPGTAEITATVRVVFAI